MPEAGHLPMVLPIQLLPFLIASYCTILREACFTENPCGWWQETGLPFL